MSYAKIQAVLESDRSFASRLIVKDTEVVIRGGQKGMVPSLVFKVGEALKSAGIELQSAHKNMILATAATIPAGDHVATPTIPATVSAPQPALVLAEPTPAKKVVKPSPPKQVVVKGAKPSDKPLPKPSPDPVIQFTDTGAIHRYQCAVASAQLLAALSQLFEKDEWPGHEERQKKLNDLIDDVEKASTQHVNLSVKQIIRAQAAQKTSREN
jgi:hypothetical protein